MHWFTERYGAEYVEHSKRFSGKGLHDPLVAQGLERLILQDDLFNDATAFLRALRPPHYKRWSQRIGPKVRSLAKPTPELKRLLDRCVLPLLRRVKAHPAAHGGEPGYSTERSLATHLPIGSVAAFDISSAFMNVSERAVFGFFYENLEGEAEERIATAGAITKLSTVRYGETGFRGLPQGSSASMPIFNRMLYPLDTALTEGALERDLLYSRWVDDIIISARGERDAGELLGAATLVESFLPIAPHKTWYKRHNPYVLLGHRIEDQTISKTGGYERPGPADLVGVDPWPLDMIGQPS